MKLSFLRSIIIMCIAAALGSCHVHQWPEQSGEPAPVPDEMVSIPLSLVYDPDFYLWEHHYDPILGTVEEDDPSLDRFPGYPGTSSKYSALVSEGVQRIHVKIFSAGSKNCVAEQSFDLETDGLSYNADLVVQAKLNPEQSYDIVVWTHFIPDAASSAFYDASNFGKISIISENYRANTDLRDGFSGRVTVNLPTDAYSVETDSKVDTDVTSSASKTVDRRVVNMRRPMGKFELLTTDLSEFLDRETSRRGLPRRARADEYRVVISFPMYYPFSYSAIDDSNEDSTTGVAFETAMQITGVSEASLGFEYVYINTGDNAGVQARVDIYFTDGSRVAGSSMFTVPMRRDCHTLLRGAFLSADGNGGVGIDPGFSGDHNVIWQ